ncbi:MAG TPA: amidohydrolase family protein [Candidatus Baltobacteraceae bacterium]|nr:amidohydrolase family protein [Candidatus Baltobacteraceae bacterium]
MPQFDILLKNGTVVDPAGDREALADVGISGGAIAAVAADLDPGAAGTVLDVAGCMVVPGIIDLHMHASAWLGGRAAHRMMAHAGVTTALDMSGPADSVLAIARDHGAGLNIATIEAVRPGTTVQGDDPSQGDLSDLLDASLRRGSIGLKILGGHYPLTPDATARTIAVANQRGAYVACHAGTSEAGSNIEGFLQAVQLAGDHTLHIAHVNSYCRGAVRPAIQETEEALASLSAHPRIRSESYLSPLNGTSAKCTGGVPESRVTQHCITQGGFPATEAGCEAAIRAGWAQINVEAGRAVVLQTGADAVRYWRDRKTDTTVSFSVNPMESRVRLAVAKRSSGRFGVDCISTDGGGIPRNVIVELGVSLIKLHGLSWIEFARKTSFNPARILGLLNKGFIGVGADADLTVIDPVRQSAVLALVAGDVIMHRGFVCGRSSRIVTTAAGAKAIHARGLESIVVDLAAGAFYRPWEDIRG